MCSVLAEILATFGAVLSESTEQTQTNITWLAATQGRTQDVLFLLDQASSLGWTPRASLIAVRCLRILIPMHVRTERLLAKPQMHATGMPVATQRIVMG